jgi:transposase
LSTTPRPEAQASRSGDRHRDPALSHALLPILQARQALFDTFLELDRPVRRAAHEDAVCRRFMGVPGVGEITGLSLKPAADHPARFKSSRTVGAPASD